MARSNRYNAKLVSNDDSHAISVDPLQNASKLLTEEAFLGVLGFDPDPIQFDFLRQDPYRCVINCTRQWGKSSFTAALAARKALSQSERLILVLSPSQPQSDEFLLKAERVLDRFHVRTKTDTIRDSSLLLPNHSRIVALPANEKTVRGFTATNLIIVDEAAHVDDSLYYTVRPSLCKSDGQIWIMSTPFGRRGFFFETFTSDDPLWKRIQVTANDCPRISKRFLDEERRIMPDWMFRQEYLCEFVDPQDTAFPSDLLTGALVAVAPLPFDRKFWATFQIVEMDPAIYRGERYFIFAVDLGQLRDPTAICVIEVATIITGPPSLVDYQIPTAKRFTIRHLQKMPLRTPYTDVVRHVCSLLRHPSVEGRNKLVIDATGCGRPVIDMFREARPDAHLTPITITSGGSPHRSGSEYRVPRNDLFTSLEVSLQSGRLGISKDLPEAQTLIKELLNLKRTINSGGTLAYEQSSQKVHDDLVFATALANWKAMERI